jgi:hypothetical protein
MKESYLVKCKYCGKTYKSSLPKVDVSWVKYICAICFAKRKHRPKKPKPKLRSPE